MYSQQFPTTERGYHRWKKQVKALLNGDMRTVKRLAKDASFELKLKRRSTLPLPF